MITLFDIVHAQVTERLYLLSAAMAPAPIKCGEMTCFDNGELYVFILKYYTVMLFLVLKFQNGGLRILACCLSMKFNTCCSLLLEADVFIMFEVTFLRLP